MGLLRQEMIESPGWIDSQALKSIYSCVVSLSALKTCSMVIVGSFLLQNLQVWDMFEDFSTANNSELIRMNFMLTEIYQRGRTIAPISSRLASPQPKHERF